MNGFLKKKCPDSSPMADFWTVFKCAFSDEYYSKHESHPVLGGGPIVNTTCSNDTNGYQVMSAQLSNDLTDVKMIVRLLVWTFSLVKLLAPFHF